MEHGNFENIYKIVYKKFYLLNNNITCTNISDV